MHEVVSVDSWSSGTSTLTKEEETPELSLFTVGGHGEDGCLQAMKKGLTKNEPPSLWCCVMSPRPPQRPRCSVLGKTWWPQQLLSVNPGGGSTSIQPHLCSRIHQHHSHLPEDSPPVNTHFREPSHFLDLIQHPISWCVPLLESAQDCGLLGSLLLLLNLKQTITVWKTMCAIHGKAKGNLWCVYEQPTWQFCCMCKWLFPLFYCWVNIFNLSRNEVSLHMSPEFEGAESQTPDQVFDSK